MGAPVGFDLDLTLVDSRPAILEAFHATSEETGVGIDLDLVAARLGIKLEDELAHWFVPAEQPAAAAIYRRYYIDLARRSTPAMPGAVASLDAVRTSGSAVVIVTAKHPMSVPPCLEAAGLEADLLFAHVHGPEKAAVLRRIRAAAYVGDTPPDMAAAVEAGVLGVGVTTGSFDTEQLEAAGAAAVLRTLEDFPDWFARLASGAPG